MWGDGSEAGVDAWRLAGWDFGGVAGVADLDWRELLSLVAKLVSTRAITQGFPPALGFRLITSIHLRGE